MNFKSPKKEIEEDLIRWKVLPCSRIGRINVVSIAILPKAIYKFKAILFKISPQFLTEIERAILKVIWSNKKLRIGEITHNNKRTGGNTISVLKLYLQSHSDKNQLILVQRWTLYLDLCIWNHVFCSRLLKGWNHILTLLLTDMWDINKWNE